MAASANPAAGNNGGQEGTNNANGTTNNGVSVPDNSVIGPNQGELIHSRGLAVEWTPDEQSLLEELLAKYVTVSLVHVIVFAKLCIFGYLFDYWYLS